jgi:glycosyltransferase involved in cell wall biosynthesis
MRILFIHQNFPGQFKHLAPALVAAGHEVVALSLNAAPDLPGVRHLRYGVGRSTSAHIHPWVSDFETKVIRGEACAKAAMQLKQQGFEPDVVYAHPGWGEALFLKDVWPKVPLLGFFEFYYHGQGADVDFDPEYPSPLEDQMRVRAKNAGNLLNLAACDAGVCPTEWQKSVHPPEFHHKLEVIFDGIDTDALRPNPGVSITLNNALRLTRTDEVITFVNRNLEPQRGWHIFVCALPEILRRRPRARVLIVGGEGVSYGAKPKDGVSYKQRYWAEVAERVDASRVHFLGHVPYAQFTALLQLSSVHVYLTYPFVLSWSVLEAMSAGALVVGSRTPPVEEVILDGENGLLVDFFDPVGVADAVDQVLDHPDRMQTLRDAARRTVIERYDLKRVCLPRQMALLERLAGRHKP